uniref:Butyrophilin-like protein 10 n=1 Tax=Acanthochromis polyacanthus TaxID=80966 RepID=A0A3Q1F8H2_9TELE
MDQTVLLLLTVSGITASMSEIVVVEEGSDATLPCSLGNNDSIEQKVFDWKKDGQEGRQEVFIYARGDYYGKGMDGQDQQFRGRVFHFAEELKNGNASITIRDTIVADSGNYTCIFPDFDPHRKYYVWLTVRTVLKPQIRILNATEDGVQLLCEVRDAFPEPSLEWRDSDGNVSSATEPLVSKEGKGFSVSLIATVTRTRTNRFQCVATQ